MYCLCIYLSEQNFKNIGSLEMGESTYINRETKLNIKAFKNNYLRFHITKLFLFLQVRKENLMDH